MHIDNVEIKIKMSSTLAEQLSGSVIRDNENVNNRGDRAAMSIGPRFVLVVTATDSDDRFTTVPPGRSDVFKRFRRWTGKRLSSLCCFSRRRNKKKERVVRIRNEMSFRKT